MSYFPYAGSEYLNYEAIKGFCEEVAERFPQWVTLEAIGKTQGQQPIYLLTIGNQQENPDEKPSIWLDGGTHCAEWTGIMSTVYTVSKWLEALLRQEDEFVTWFNKATAYVLPCISPDGFIAMMSGRPFIRSSLRKATDEKLIKGFEPSDIDENGEVCWMRWQHPAGPFAIDTSFPALMRPRRLDDAPENAYFCTFEGAFTNWDDVQLTAAPLRNGVDLNRNFPAHWQPFSMFGTDGGDFSLSEPESHATVTAFKARPYICAAITNHTYGGCILTQPYRPNSPLKETDIALMHWLAKALVEGSDYRTFKVYPDFSYKENQTISGLWSDTITTIFGVPGYTLELWRLYHYVGMESIHPVDFIRGKDINDVKAVLRELIKRHPDIERPWQPFSHPQLGEVEIGGIDYMRSVRNPPQSVLAPECEVAYQSANRLRASVPEIKVDIQCETIAPGVFKINVILENVGCLSTSGLQIGEQIISTPQVAVSIGLPMAAERVSGAFHQKLPHLNGWGNAVVTSQFGQNPIYPTLPSKGHIAVATWLVKGAGTYQFEWQAGRAGKGQCSITLPEACEG